MYALKTCFPIHIRSCIFPLTIDTVFLAESKINRDTFVVCRKRVWLIRGSVALTREDRNCLSTVRNIETPRIIWKREALMSDFLVYVDLSIIIIATKMLVFSLAISAKI